VRFDVQNFDGVIPSRVRHYQLPASREKQMTQIQHGAGAARPREHSGGSVEPTRGAFATEDWWAVWIGLGAVVLAYVVFKLGGSIKWITISPAKWSTLSAVARDLAAHWINYLALSVAFAALFGVSVASLGESALRFARAFAALFVASVLVFAFGAWTEAAHYNPTDIGARPMSVIRSPLDLKEHAVNRNSDARSHCQEIGRI
jgi:hypothetical protein